MRHTSTGHGWVFAGTSPGFVYHLVNLLSGVGPVLVLLGIGGLAYAAYRRQAWAFAALAFFLPYYLLIGRAEVKFMRYTFPLDLALALGVGYVVATGHRKGGAMRFAVAAAGIGLAGIPMGGLASTIRMTGLMMAPDPRDQAIRALRQEGVSNVGLAVDPWTWSVPLFKDAAAPLSVSWALRSEIAAAEADPKMVYYLTPAGDRTTFDPHLVTELKPDRIVITSLELPPNIERLVGSSAVPEEFRAQINGVEAFEKALDASYDRTVLFGPDGQLGEFDVEDMRYIQPVLKVWKRKTSTR